MKCSLFSQCVNFKASISDKEIDSFASAKQYFSDCYIMSSLESLTQNENGRKILKNNIEHDDTDPSLINCYLYDKNGIRQKYTVPAKTAVKGYEELYAKQNNEIIRAVDISVGEYEKKYKSKPWICRIADDFKTYSFEDNLPSHFLKMFTGITPTVNIAETDMNLDLSKYKKEVMQLFERMQKEKDYSMIIATGPKTLDERNWHVYVIKDVNLENNTITVKEKRKNTPQTMSIDKAINTFKYIVGYFNSDLETNSESQQ